MRHETLIELSTKVFCRINNSSSFSLLSRTRESNAVRTRKMIWGYLRANTDLSLTELGKIFNRDHPTALHSMKQHNNAISISPNGFPFDKEYADKFNEGYQTIRSIVDEYGNGPVYKDYMLTYHVKRNDTYIAPIVRSTSLVEAINEYEIHNTIIDEELILAQLA